MAERIISPEPLTEEGDDPTIRPDRLEEFVGQAQGKGEPEDRDSSRTETG